MKVKVATDMSTIIYHMDSSHCVIMEQCSDKISRYCSVMLCQVTVHQDPKFQTYQLKFDYATSLYPRKVQTKSNVFDLGMFKPLWVVLVELELSTFEGMEWQYRCGKHLWVWKTFVDVENSYKNLLKVKA